MCVDNWYVQTFLCRQLVCADNWFVQTIGLCRQLVCADVKQDDESTHNLCCGGVREDSHVPGVEDKIAVCGDGLVNTEVGEECDDGNNLIFDGCDSTCRIEQNWLCLKTPRTDVLQAGGGPVSIHTKINGAFTRLLLPFSTNEQHVFPSA